MKVNKKLLPIKGHYFFFNAGTAPLVPYLSTYARQLGFSSATVGLIYTVLPIFGLVAKPLFGVIADRFQIQKSIFILFQVVTIVSFSLIYVVPGREGALEVQLDCGDGVTVLRTCFAPDGPDTCSVQQLGDSDTTTQCDMKCDMSSARMWQTVCEHWQVPAYCYSNTERITYAASLDTVSAKEEEGCALIATNNITLDGLSYAPHCMLGHGHIDVNEPCHLNCTNDRLSAVIADSTANMTCVNKTFHYKYCGQNAKEISGISDLNNTQCQASCDLEPGAPWRLMEICSGLGADAAETCSAHTPSHAARYPQRLQFTADVALNTTITQNDCVYMQIKRIHINGSVHYPTCISKAQYQLNAELFHASCQISCDDYRVNELIQSAVESHETSGQYGQQFWFFFALMIISWIGQAVVVTFADAICFNLLGEKSSGYGKQRLWGSVGWGVFSLLTGALIDSTSDGAYKNYAVAFILMFVFMTGDVIVSCFLKIESPRMSVSIISAVGGVFASVQTVVFVCWTVCVGLCTGLLWQFLFWHLEDIAGASCNDGSYTKTLQGLVSAIQTFGGEIPFMFLSGYILRKLGHVHTMSAVLFAFGVRFLLYSVLTDAWWVLPVEMLQGVTFGMFYPTMASYASVVAPPGTETTVQGLVGAIFEGVGTSLGSFIGGRLYETYGGWNTFRWFGIASLVFCILHMIVQYFIPAGKDDALAQGYSSVIKYEQNDVVHILEETVDEH